jgi:hypothetical protein
VGQSLDDLALTNNKCVHELHRFGTDDLQSNQLQQLTQSAHSRNARSVGFTDYYSQHDKSSAPDEPDYGAAHPNDQPSPTSQEAQAMSRISRPSPYGLWSKPSLSTYSAILSNRPETPVDLMTIEQTQWRHRTAFS